MSTISVVNSNYQDKVYGLKKNDAGVKNAKKDVSIQSGSNMDTIDFKSSGFTANDPEWVTEAMPAGCFGIEQDDKTNQKILDTMKQRLADFYQGNATIDDLIQNFKDCFQAIKNYNVEKHRTTADDVKNNTQMLEDTYDVFRQYAVGVAQSVCEQEGRKIAEQYGIEGNVDWVYYDADYYYESEGAKAAIRDCAAQMAKELNLGDVKLPTNFGNDVAMSLYDTFNTAWSWDSEQNVGCCAMLDPKQEPPEGFKLFFKERKYPENTKEGELSQNGVFQISIGDWKTEAEVPFSYNFADKFGHYNLLDLIKAPSNMSNSDRINLYLRNFDVYMKFYAFGAGKYQYSKS